MESLLFKQRRYSQCSYKINGFQKHGSCLVLIFPVTYTWRTVLHRHSKYLWTQQCSYIEAISSLVAFRIWVFIALMAACCLTCFFWSLPCQRGFNHANTYSSVSKNRDCRVSEAFKFYFIGKLKHCPLPSMVSEYASVNGVIKIYHEENVQQTPPVVDPK